jgi:hypothetical protein
LISVLGAGCLGRAGKVASALDLRYRYTSPRACPSGVTVFLTLRKAFLLGKSNFLSMT